MKVIPIKPKDTSMLDEFVADFKDGKVNDAIIIAIKGDDIVFIPLTSTPIAYLGWMCHEGAHSIHHMEDDEE